MNESAAEFLHSFHAVIEFEKFGVQKIANRAALSSAVIRQKCGDLFKRKTKLLSLLDEKQPLDRIIGKNPIPARSSRRNGEADGARSNALCRCSRRNVPQLRLSDIHFPPIRILHP